MTEKQIVNRGNTIEFYDPKKVEAYLNRYVPKGTDLKVIVDNITEYVGLEDKVTSLKIQQELYSVVEGLISTNESFWQNVAGCIKADIFRKEVINNRGFEKGLKKVFELGYESNQYTDFFKKYTDEEIAELQEELDNERDYYVNHAGVHIAYNRYTTVSLQKEVVKGKEIVTGTKKIETLQERYMAISMFLNQNEVVDRIKKVKAGYLHMSGKEIAVDFTVATPTFMNAGRPNGNLSSCFVGMVGDSIDDIYREAEQFAKVSKNAGGYGLYFGKVRSLGSSIRQKPGLSSGSVPFMKLFDVTAGTVDQQGQRPGAVTITLDAWHRDLSDFLKSPLNNTALEKQMNKIFLAVSMPDLFFRKLQNEEDWYQFDPKEVQDIMGWALEDSYDETLEGGTFTERYEACIQAYKDGYLQLVDIVDPWDVLSEINKTRIEKGHPFLFFRDTVNRDNPNEGMIYCSNLCTEITITMSLPEVESKIMEINGEQVIAEFLKPGDTPTCNLSSINMAKIAKVRMAGGDWKQHIADVVKTQYRMLANVIELNSHDEMEQTKISSFRKREVGLGEMGNAHALAISHIAPDSEEAIEWLDEVNEEITYNVVKASMELAKERNDIAPAFETSKWADGSYIREKFIPYSRDKQRWEELNQQVITHGMYSLVLRATAPTETISYVANTTAGADPIYGKEYTLEKAGLKTNMVAPDIAVDNFFYYKDAFIVNKEMFLKTVGRRQRWIDQASSTNLYYIKDNLEALDVVQDYITAWKEGVKTLYYHRGESLEAYEAACEACAG
ncbi:ribonucleotide reductase [Bacillus phage vB_BmeM-Goe8]|uniref:Ribonucleoside-diphosphate reductase n=1 Tax=Bacillus phage vB_BmeM-Goe8 TaxID=2593638 RepID=A0A516KMS2_9CAUD|nr:ribonucleotide reductase [Bacillus phage vB_BmeM-Goe8]QDP42893.1 ribonucleoside-diphosphate reductase large subunit [Bacillus phage vB_BmeM-Goe8]